MRVMSRRQRSSERNLSEVPGRSLCPGWSRDVSGLWPRTGGECQPQRMSAMSSGNIFRPGPLRNLFFSILLERQHLYLAVLGVKPLTFNNFQLQFSHLNHSFLHLFALPISNHLYDIVWSGRSGHSVFDFSKERQVVSSAFDRSGAAGPWPFPVLGASPSEETPAPREPVALGSGGDAAARDGRSTLE